MTTSPDATGNLVFDLEVPADFGDIDAFLDEIRSQLSISLAEHGAPQTYCKSDGDGAKKMLRLEMINPDAGDLECLPNPDFDAKQKINTDIAGTRAVHRASIAWLLNALLKKGITVPDDQKPPNARNTPNEQYLFPAGVDQERAEEHATYINTHFRDVLMRDAYTDEEALIINPSDNITNMLQAGLIARNADDMIDTAEIMGNKTKRRAALTAYLLQQGYMAMAIFEVGYTRPTSLEQWPKGKPMRTVAMTTDGSKHRNLHVVREADEQDFVVQEPEKSKHPRKPEYDGPSTLPFVRPDAA